jgi:uncharacterized protein (DUF2267 family)
MTNLLLSNDIVEVYKNDAVTNIIITGGAYKNFINVTKWAQGERDFKKWRENQKTKTLIATFQRLEGRQDLTVPIFNGPVHLRGLYVHPRLAIQFAMWLSPEFAHMVSCLVEKHMSIEFEKQYKELQEHHREALAQLRSEFDAQHRSDLEQIQMAVDRENVLQNTISEVVGALDVTRRQAEEAVQMAANLQQTLARTYIDTVPTRGWDTFSLYRLDNGSYKVARGRTDTHLGAKPANTVYSTQVPNGIEFFATFRSDHQGGPLFKFNWNTISLLPPVQENILLQLLAIHRERLSINQ